MVLTRIDCFLQSGSDWWIYNSRGGGCYR